MLIKIGFNKFTKQIERSLEGCIEDDGLGRSVGIYAVLLTGLVQAAEKAAPTSNAKKATDFDWSHLKLPLIEGIKRIFGLELGRVVDVQTDREAIVSNLVKSLHLLIESPAGLKQPGLKKAVQECWVLAVTRHDYVQGMKTIMLQDLNYYEVLMEPMAEFVAQLAQVQDNPPLVSELLAQLGHHRFSTSESGSVKIVSIFLTALGRLAPREALRNITSFINHLDCESYVMRMGMVEIIGALIGYLGEQDVKTDQIKTQIKSFLAVLEERLMDINAFVRAKVIHIFTETLRNGSLPISQRARVLSAVTGRISDKSSNVRRKAIQILGEFLRTHPFCVEGGELSLSYFYGRLEEIDKLIASSSVSPLEEDASASVSMSDIGDMDEPQRLFDPAKISTLLLQKRYYTDATQFVRHLESVIPTLCQLLSSTVKTEVVDVIDFFVEAYLYRLDGAEVGIRRMMHLVWERDLSYEDGTKHSIKEYLFEAYKKIYLETGDHLSGKAKCDQVALNLTSMLQGASMSELTSLEPIIHAMVEKRWVSDGVVQSLFGLFSDPEKRRPALIILSMMSTLKSSTILPKMDLIIKAGFSPNTDPITAQYTLMAVRSLAGEGNGRLPVENLIFSKIIDFVRLSCTSLPWFEPISEAIKTIYGLCETPSKLVEPLIQELFNEIFSQMEDTVNVNMMSRLLHIVGQVASCESKHLDTVERHWKAANGVKASQTELEQIGGATAEDDFTDLIGQVRDHELLYGQDSLLSLFGPLVVFITSNNAEFNDPTLQRVATLVLAKFMAISSAYCQENLALFLTILDKSPDATIRSNLVIAFGDLVQSFARIIDENIGYLFARLDDPDAGVRRNTLLVLTHLTLTGLIKVKGQIGEIAKCILDEDERIGSLACLFFHELASKDPAIIYNHVPDILSSLTSSTAALSEQDFQHIMHFVMDFIKKERQMESLLEKLCQRFRHCSTPRQARDLAYCLSLVSYNSERSFRKLVEAFPLYQDKLEDYGTFRLFADILHKAKKTCRGGAFSNAAAEKDGKPVVSSSATEVKSLFEDFESKLLRFAGQHDGTMRDDGEEEDDPEADVFNPRSRASQKLKKKAVRAKKFQLPSTDEEDEEDAGLQSGGMDEEVESGEEALPQPKVREKIKFSRKQGFVI